ncbi:aminotransferase [Enterovirga rhinocerotis]|uniref:8-amino-7-oxononanoate synthase n=1 Tax=Enterovirga rhinocerotis TaxID=1339210 RepID=A0A4R7CA05_9HYPH|nr:aminotransferase [Enterovirga rhinocerotis]TDR94892.1 hypothetical protein EV668_2183 [Enterovirga rhinocerotis]
MRASINPDVLAVSAPPIPEARAWAARYDGRHGPAIDLTQAVPGYPAHPGLVDRLSGAAGAPTSFGYGEIVGDAALREAYAGEVSALYGGDIAPGEVAITSGANLAAFAVTMALARAGDAVMMPVPWYFNYQMNLGLLGIETVGLPCRPEAGFVPDPGEAEALLTDRVRAIMLVSPNNPTGAVYPPEVIAGFADLCRRRGIVLVLDETYRDFLPAGLGRAHDLFAGSWRDHLIGLCSFSKSYCVPGFRAGAVIAGPRFIPQIAKILDCVQICAPRVGQAGLAWAIWELGAWRAANRAVMNGRAEACRAVFAALPGWEIGALGAYFAYLRHPFDGVGSAKVSEEMAARRGVLTLPGSAFGPGQEDYIRLAFANCDEARLEEAATRLRDFTPG